MLVNLDALLLDIRFAIEDYQTQGSYRLIDSYTETGWILSDVEVSSLTRKESYVSLPHANDVIDFSEYGGQAHYEPREVKYTFWQSFNNHADMVHQTQVFENMCMSLSVNSRYDRIYDPTIFGANTSTIGYWARPRCIGFERHYKPLSNLSEVTVTFRVYPIPQSQALN